jgi:hypothetical protein
LKEDLGETIDLSAQHPEKVQELTEIMNVFMKELEVKSRPVGTLPSISDNQLEEIDYGARTSPHFTARLSKNDCRDCSDSSRSETLGRC